MTGPDPLHPLGRCTCGGGGTCPLCVRHALVEASDLPAELKALVRPHPLTVLGRDAPPVTPAVPVSDLLLALETAQLALGLAREQAAMWEQECKRITLDAANTYAEAALLKAEVARLKLMVAKIDSRRSDH